MYVSIHLHDDKQVYTEGLSPLRDDCWIRACEIRLLPRVAINPIDSRGGRKHNRILDVVRRLAMPSYRYENVDCAPSRRDGKGIPGITIPGIASSVSQDGIRVGRRCADSICPSSRFLCIESSSFSLAACVWFWLIIRMALLALPSSFLCRRQHELYPP